MTNQDLVSYETAKLLKEAGYPQIWQGRAYDPDGDLHAHLCETDEEYACTAPHLWDAMRWLREEKKLAIDIYIWHNGYSIAVCHLDKPTKDLLGDGAYESIPTYEQACDIGIKAACEWLISQDVDTK